ncbi:MAG TPA: class I adenylate-forming enzyme family protein [Opitutaceae bacterium]
MSERLDDCWAELVRRDPRAPALLDGASGRGWTRAELAAGAEAWRGALPPTVGAALARRRVAIVAPNGAGWLHVFLGLLQHGAIPCALDGAEPAEAQRATAADLGAAWLWRDGRLEPVLPGRQRERRGDLCLIKLTSGSTGRPRALMFTHAQMIADGRQVCATMGIRPDDVNAAVIPFGHSYGLGNLVVPLLAQGTAIACVSSPLPQVLVAESARVRATVFPAVPALLRALVRSDLGADALAGVRLVISAGAPLPPETARAFAEKFGRRVHGFYGSSETGGIAYDRTGEATLTGRSVGQPMEGVRLAFGRGHRFTVESAAVVGRGIHRPADRAELNAEGEVVLLGRTGRLVKIAGRRVDLAEIEATLRATPGVRDAYAMPHPARSDALAAAVVSELSPLELRARLSGRVAAWKIPERLRVMPEFPLTPRGKPDTRRLKALLEEA